MNSKELERLRNLIGDDPSADTDLTSDIRRLLSSYEEMRKGLDMAVGRFEALARGCDLAGHERTADTARRLADEFRSLLQEGADE